MATIRRALLGIGPGYVLRKSPGKELWTIYRLVHDGQKIRGSEYSFTHPLSRAEVEEFPARSQAGEVLLD